MISDLKLTTPGGCALPTGEWERVLRFFPPDLRAILAKLNSKLQPQTTEIRLRANQPLELLCGTRAGWLTANGELVDEPQQAVFTGAELLKNVVNAITVGSYYALAESIAQGYLALPGGYRVGFAGHVVHENGRIRLIRDISSLNFRIAKSLPGIARPLIPLLCKDGRFLKTLILAPPASGKTTLLREIIRVVSNGVPGIILP
ncbi:MAG TPA: stage III sporulation protein AA, partial [Bacillota bacterium]|nr:stage III sporulation protein AA [Bacillota bacterium]